MEKRESRCLEWKETVSSSFLKTVSAYANYGTGEILFGVRDDGEVIGLDDPEAQCLDIENRINDSIEPVPDYTLSVNRRTRVVTLTVREGLYKPYLYKAKAYRRADSATVPVDRLEMTRLILEGQNQTFEEMPAKRQSLTFSALEEKLRETLHVDGLTADTLKTLELYRDGAGYNNAAELLADVNGFRGTDIVRFGESINILMDRETLDNISVLTQYDRAIALFEKYYQYELIDGPKRLQKELIPETAFREVMANALVHRSWDVEAPITVGLFPDRIEVTSPGGLPRGVSEAEYERGGLSVLRNRIIGGVFYRLNLIERFGTGIRRVNEAYRSSQAKPSYELTPNAVKVILPVVSAASGLTPDEQTLISLLQGRDMSSAELAQKTGWSRSKVVSLLHRLADEGRVSVIGQGRGTRYTAGRMA